MQDGQENRHLVGGVQVVIKVLEGAQGIEAILEALESGPEVKELGEDRI